MKAINPATEEVIRDYPEHQQSDVDQLLERAEGAYRQWRTTDFRTRSEALRRAADVLRQKQNDLAQLITTEMGKPITEAEAEVEKCAWVCRYSADHAEQFLADEPQRTEARRSYVRYEPLGPVLAIMPWNFPLWQVFRFAAPALMAGNVALLKHSPNVPGCALAAEQALLLAGVPDGVFTTLMIDVDAAARVIEHPAVRAVTLTGSERAGIAVATQAGKVLKKTVLELGGSDPFIVLPDVDVEHVAVEAAKARCINTGQSCIAAKRFIVDRSIAERFAEALVAAMAGLKMGDPMARDTKLGPLARQDLLENLEEQVRRSIAAGARCLTGGGRRQGRGYYFEPTVLADVRPGMPAFDDETFGPVAAVIRADDLDDAIHLANRSRYGLAASIWTRDRRKGEELAARLEAGCVFVNEIVKSDPRLPFGGVKRSGYGRELARHGIREFVNVKSVWVA